ncbi:hypothetical protein [Methylomonas albis]|uniref:Uncharacterized protein n=1 Tax=Methylomonas albis TaxID=1854563 RepID=A0ABR9CW89_9GAMM|nr:hypothetical protein [Methylomonas albis]MBD9355126.1 hypothetical protein [Methylomonas albis]
MMHQPAVSVEAATSVGSFSVFRGRRILRQCFTGKEHCGHSAAGNAQKNALAAEASALICGTDCGKAKCVAIGLASGWMPRNRFEINPILIKS